MVEMTDNNTTKDRMHVEWLLTFEWSFDTKYLTPEGAIALGAEKLVSMLYPPGDDIQFFNLEELVDYKIVAIIRHGKTIVSFEKKVIDNGE